MRLPGAADGMAKSNRAAIHIEGIAIKVKLTIAGQYLRGESFVEFDQVEVGQLQIVLLRHLAQGGDRTDAHDARVDAGRCRGQNAGQRLKVVLPHEGCAGQNYGRCSVGDAGGVSGGNRSFFWRIPETAWPAFQGWRRRKGAHRE